MPNDEMENDLRGRWQSQPDAGGKMSVEGIRVEAQKFHDRIRKRNIREYIASAITILILLFEIRFLKLPPPYKVAQVLWIAAALVMVYQLRKRGSPRALPSDLGSPCLDFHRRELERQRDFLRGVRLWGAIPNAVVLIVAISIVAVSFAPNGLIMASFFTVFFAAMFTFFAKVNRRAAQRLQRKIDELRD